MFLSYFNVFEIYLFIYQLHMNESDVTAEWFSHQFHTEIVHVASWKVKVRKLFKYETDRETGSTETMMMSSVQQLQCRRGNSQ